MPIDPISVATILAPWAYETAKREHQCVKCGRWKLTITRVTSCCERAICDSCSGNSLIRRNGVMCCPSCGHEFT